MSCLDAHDARAAKSMSLMLGMDAAMAGWTANILEEERRHQEDGTICGTSALFRSTRPLQIHSSSYFGGLSPQLRSRGVAANSLQMPMTLPVGNAPQRPKQLFVYPWSLSFSPQKQSPPTCPLGWWMDD